MQAKEFFPPFLKAGRAHLESGENTYGNGQMSIQYGLVTFI